MAWISSHRKNPDLVWSGAGGYGMNFEEYYQTPHWQNIRKQRLEIDDYICRTCGENGKNYSLQVHHVRYNNFTENVEKDLITLCKPCHEAITNIIRERRFQSQNISIPIITERITSYGLEESNIQINLSVSVNSPQRGIGKPDESPSTADEKV